MGSLTTGNAGARFVFIMRIITIVITRRIIMEMDVVFNDDILNNLWQFDHGQRWARLVVIIIVTMRRMIMRMHIILNDDITNNPEAV